MIASSSLPPLRYRRPQEPPELWFALLAGSLLIHSIGFVALRYLPSAPSVDGELISVEFADDSLGSQEGPQPGDIVDPAPAPAPPAPQAPLQPNPEPSPEITLDPDPRPSPTIPPSPTPSPTPKPSPTPTPKPSPTITAKPRPKPQIALLPSPRPSPALSPSPSPSPSPSSSIAPSPSPTLSPTPLPPRPPTQPTIPPTPPASPETPLPPGEPGLPGNGGAPGQPGEPGANNGGQPPQANGNNGGGKNGGKNGGEIIPGSGTLPQPEIGGGTPGKTQPGGTTPGGAGVVLSGITSQPVDVPNVEAARPKQAQLSVEDITYSGELLQTMGPRFQVKARVNIDDQGSILDHRLDTNVRIEQPSNLSSRVQGEIKNLIRQIQFEPGRDTKNNVAIATTIELTLEVQLAAK